MPGVAPLDVTFEKHAQRRAAGLPTPAVLLGEEVADAWVGPHRARGAVHIGAREIELAIAAYLEAPLVRARIREIIEARVGASSVTTRTAFEETVWTTRARNSLLASGDEAAILFEENASRIRVMRAVSTTLGEMAPALMLDAAGDLDAALRTAVALVEAAPRSCVAVVTDRAAWQGWLAIEGREHAKALLEPCVVELPRGPHESAPGVTEARALAAVAKRSRATADEDAARSAAERALFEALQSAPESRDQFMLNRRLDVLFGSRPLEIDLACQALRVAVEVDGYFHFQAPDAYRRDRRKDILLEELGYFVVRVLAEDVTENLDGVVGTIHRVMRHVEKAR